MLQVHISRRAELPRGQIYVPCNVDPRRMSTRRTIRASCRSSCNLRLGRRIDPSIVRASECH